MLASLLGALPAAAQQDSKTEAARRADETWLALVDGGQYPQSWKDASPAFQAAVTQEKWVKALESIRTPLGSLKSRRLISANYSTVLPGVPDGEYEVIIFETIFEHKPLANETVISKLDKDGTWRVAGYYIK